MKILIQMNINSYMESKIEELKKAHKDLEIFTDTDSAPLAEIEIITGGLLTEKLIQQSSSLKMVFVPFVGVNHLPLGLLRERGIRICNSHGNDRFVAERVLALLLAFHGRIVEFHKALENEIWHGFWPAAEKKTRGIPCTGKRLQYWEQVRSAGKPQKCSQSLKRM